MENKNKSITFQEYQLKVAELYESIYLVFESANLIWWVHSGTLLGIVRHRNKMVPWDDDIDMMISYHQWIRNKEFLKEKFFDNNFFTFDFTEPDMHCYSNFPFLKIYSNESFLVKSYDGNNINEMRPFVDVFFACDSNIYSDLDWKKYSKLINLSWITKKGFKRWELVNDNIFKRFLINAFTYPIKFLIPKKKIENFISMPLINDKRTEILRRVDKWSFRKIDVNINEGLIITNLFDKKAIINKYYLEELENSYGKKWKIPKVYANHNCRKTNLKRDIYIEDFFKKMD